MRKFALSIFFAAIHCGCVSVTARSHVYDNNTEIKKVDKSVFLVVNDFYFPSEKFLTENLPFSKVQADPQWRLIEGQKGAEELAKQELESAGPQTDYSLDVIVDRQTLTHNFWGSLITICTLGLIPGKESIPINVAARLTNKQNGKSRDYFYAGKVEYWFSTLPIFWEYFGNPNGPESDLRRALLQKLSLQIKRDLKDGRI